LLAEMSKCNSKKDNMNVNLSEILCHTLRVTVMYYEIIYYEIIYNTITLIN